uniref:hypothetical protein n=1 Tax=Limnohabitans sp. TaxID=1907725 RepID=UPI0040483D99
MEEFYLGEKLEELKTLSFKFNIGDQDHKESVENIRMYVMENSKKCYYIAGRHDEGRNEQPHVHVNFLVEDYIATSHESRRRNKCFNDLGYRKLDNLTMREGVVIDLDSAQKCLAYPLKEGKLVSSSSNIPVELQKYLESYAKIEYEAKKQQALSKQRASEKTENLQNQILALLPSNLHFTDYGSYKRYIYTKFYETLQINEYPQRRTVESAVQNIAIFRKIVEPWYFDKY